MSKLSKSLVQSNEDAAADGNLRKKKRSLIRVRSKSMRPHCMTLLASSQGLLGSSIADRLMIRIIIIIESEHLASRFQKSLKLQSKKFHMTQ